MATVFVCTYGPPASGATLTWPQTNSTQPCFGVGLQGCIGVAQPGDVVQVATNTPVNENLTIDKSLTLRAASGFTPVLGPARSIFVHNPATKANITTVRDFTLQEGRVFAVQGSQSPFNVTFTNLDILSAVNTFTELEIRTDQAGSYGPTVFDISNNDLTVPATPQVSGTLAISIQGDFMQSVTGVIRNNRINQFDGEQGGGIQLYNLTANPFDIDVIANEIRGSGYNNGIKFTQVDNGHSVIRCLDNLVTGQANVAGVPGCYVFDIGQGSADFELVNNTAANSGNGVVIDGGSEVGATWTGLVANNIVSGMTSRGMSIEAPPQTPGAVANDHNLVFNTVFNFFTPGPGTLFVDPLFVGGADYRLTDASPARNSGNAAHVPNDLVTDLGGGPRQVDTVDMGAYETTTPVASCFTEVAAGLPGVFGASQPSPSTWGDYDNDGDLDILLTGYTGGSHITRVYRNNGAPVPTFSDINAGLASGSDAAAAWGDYDGDGDLDIVVARAGNSLLYRNSGGANPTFSDAAAGLPGAGIGAVAWGDYDKDGDLDLLLAGNDGTTPATRLFRNSGGANPAFTQVTGATLTGLTYATVAWGDYDNDRDLDILIAGHDGTTTVTKLYRNNGGASPPFTEVGAGLAGVHIGSVAWGDYDNDGDLDILLTGSSFALGSVAKIYRNSGGASPTFTDVGAALPPVGLSAAVWGDYDNDGDLDVLLTGVSAAGRVVRLYQNSGGTNPVFFEATGARLAVGFGSVTWGDADRDGDLDILLTGFDDTAGATTRLLSNGCAPHANNPPVSPTSLTAIAGTTATLSWNAAADAETPAASLTYNLRVGTAPGGSNIVSPHSDPASGARRVAIHGNMNHNQAWDVVLPGPGTYYWSIQAVDGAFAGSAWAAEQTMSLALCFEDAGAGLAGVSASTVAWGDYDNDGDLDALVSGVGSTGGVTILYRSSGGPNPTFSDAGAGLPGTNGGSLAWGDYDNDNDLDILLTGSGTAAIYRNNGEANPTFTNLGGFLPSLDNSAVAWGDFDNDNDLDILLTGETGGSTKITRLYRNNGSTNPPFSNYGGGGSLTAVSQGSVAWGDYDRDNDLDFLLTGADQASNPIAKVYRSSGGPNPTFSQVGAVTLTAVSRSSASWGDFDNDGDLDILLAGVAGSTGLTKVYRNNGSPSPTFTDIGAGLPGVATSSSAGCAAWGDYDNDGRLDILLTGAGLARVYRNSGGPAPTFSDISAFLRPVQASAAVWGDYDNDGDLDILHTGSATDPAGPSAQVYRNVCGSASASAVASRATSKALAGPNTPPSAPGNLRAWTDGSLVHFEWDASQDAQTPPAAISYNLRVGTTPGSSDIVASMANPSTGFRRIPALLGNAGQRTTWELHRTGPITFYWSVQAVDGASAGSAFTSEETPVDAFEAGTAGAVGYTLSHRGGNPFSNATTIEFSQPAGGRVALEVYDIAGRKVRTLIDDTRPAGRSKAVWDGRDAAGFQVASGIYFVRMTTAAIAKSQKISLVR